MTVEGEDSEGYLPCLDEDLQFFEVNRILVYYTFGSVFMLYLAHLSTSEHKMVQVNNMNQSMYLIRESPSQFENRIVPRVYIRSITHSTMYQKAPFC